MLRHLVLACPAEGAALVLKNREKGTSDTGRDGKEGLQPGAAFSELLPLAASP